MIKFKIQYLDKDRKWIDSRTAFTLEEAERKEKEVKETGFLTKIVEIKDEKTDT